MLDHSGLTIFIVDNTDTFYVNPLRISSLHPVDFEELLCRTATPTIRLRRERRKSKKTAASEGEEGVENGEEGTREGEVSRRL